MFGRANPAHKCSRTSSDFFSNKSLATQNRQATSSVCNRQPNCSNIMNKLSKTHSHQLSLLAIELWHFALKMNLTLSAVYVPGIKNCIADRKSRVFNDSLKWMLNLQVFQQMLLKMHGIKVHLFASRINHQLTAFVSWRPEPGAMACDAFNLNWGLMKGYLLPPFCLIHRCKKRIQQDQAECILITQVWKSRPCYPVILSLLADRPLLLPKDRKLLQLPGTDKVDPLRSQKNFHLAAWPLSGKKYQNRSFLLKCQRYLQASWRQKTTCQYESAWKAWSCWCDQRQVDPSSTSSNVILEFLAELLHKGYKYRTIGVYRSTISNFHHPIDGIVIGKHLLMSKFKKGVYSMCPLEPKYFVTQDVNQVLSFLKTWAPVEKLTLKQLTLKLVTLAALTSAPRSSSVHKMDLCFRQLKSNGILLIPELTKCSGPKRPLKELFLVSFPKIGGCVPHRHVSLSTIAQWVKSVLTLSGINTESFSAHSTRAAASSAAARARVALKDVMNAADWTNESTFKKFYHKPAFSASFGKGF